MDKKVAVIIGAGPAGTTAAACLAKRGYQCEVFERRAELKKGQSLRGYPMGLNARAFRTFDLSGLRPDSIYGPNACPRQAFYLDGKAMAVFKASEHRENNNYLVDRLVLGQELVTAASAQNYSASGGSIRWHWGQEVKSIDFEKRVVVCGPAAMATSGTSPQKPGANTSYKYDLLIGADGAKSAVRAALAAALPESVKVATKLKLTCPYKTFHDLPITPGVASSLPGISEQPVGYALHVFKVPGMLFTALWKQGDGTMSGLMVSWQGYQADDLRERLEHTFVKKLPGLAEWVELIIKQVSDDEKQAGADAGKVVRVSQFHGPSCVLLGDAAHAVTAGLGQGCNMALESVKVFIETLDRVGLETAPEEFSRVRVPDAHAFQDLEMMWQFVRINQPVQLDGIVRPPSFYERTRSMALLYLSALPNILGNKLLPSLFKQGSVFQALRNPDVPYWELRRGIIRGAALGAAGMAAVLAVATAAVMRRAMKA